MVNLAWTSWSWIRWRRLKYLMIDNLVLRPNYSVWYWSEVGKLYIEFEEVDWEIYSKLDFNLNLHAKYILLCCVKLYRNDFMWRFRSVKLSSLTFFSFFDLKDLNVLLCIINILKKKQRKKEKKCVKMPEILWNFILYCILTIFKKNAVY